MFLTAQVPLETHRNALVAKVIICGTGPKAGRWFLRSLPGGLLPWFKGRGVWNHRSNPSSVLCR